LKNILKGLSKFYDMETGRLLLKVGQYGEDPMGFEGRVMNKTFEKIRSHFGLWPFPYKKSAFSLHANIAETPAI
jgi:hypothetical protein